MRCNNCGYSQSPSGAVKCEKCGSALNSGNDQPVAPSNEFVSKTINGEQASQPAWDPSASSRPKNTCKNCGYPVSGDVQFCPNCGNSYSDKKEIKNQVSDNKNPIPNKAGTIDPWKSKKGGKFMLTPIARENEDTLAPISFNGSKIELNRDNLDPNNNTITSKVQAIISQDNNGNWVIENQSTRQTTFVRIEGPLELKKGDYILMGDRLFKFDF
jgi:hypothetical protein